MKKLFVIEDTLTNQVSFWHLAAFLITLPFDFFYSQIVLVSFAVHTLIHCRRENLQGLRKPALMLLGGFFLLGLLSISYSTDKPEGISIVTRQLALLIIPILFALTGLDLKKYTERLLLIFGLTCMATVLYLYADAIHTIAYFHLPWRSLFSLVFMNHNFSLPIEMHATYLSLYVAFSIIVFSRQLIKERTWAMKFICLCIIGILSLGLLQLSSRAVFISILLVFNIAFPVFVFTGRQRVRFMVVSVLLSVSLLLVISRVDSFKVRYINELKTDLSGKVALIEINEPRMARWELIAGLIKRSPVIGYGTGSEKRMLKEKYFENRLFNSYIQEFNAHSEYLSLMLKMGIFGLLYFGIILFAGFRTSWKNRDLPLMGFLILVTIVCVSENLLDLNKGIFFFSFFYPLFLWKTRSESLIKSASAGNPNTENIV